MTERDLPSIAGEQHQAEADDGVDQYEMKLGENIAADEEGRGEQQNTGYNAKEIQRRLYRLSLWNDQRF